METVPRPVNVWVNVGTVLAVAVIALGVVATLSVPAWVTPGNRTEPVNQNQATPCRSVRVGDSTSEQVNRCRRHGWTIGAHYALSPNNNRMWAAVPPCPTDEIVPGQRCHWNARTQGNGHGESFVHLGGLGVFTGLTRINGHNAEGRS